MGEESVDGGAFAAAYRMHHEAVYAVAVRTGSARLAEDVVQEVFLRHWRRPSGFDAARGSLRTYLLIMAHSVAVDQIRAENARHAREERGARHPAAGSAAPEDIAELDDLKARVVHALGTLGQGRHDAIVTAYFGGLTYREAAEVLGEPEGTIKSRIRAGLSDLKRELGREVDEAPLLVVS